MGDEGKILFLASTDFLTIELHGNGDETCLVCCLEPRMECDAMLKSGVLDVSIGSIHYPDFEWNGRRGQKEDIKGTSLFTNPVLLSLLSR